MDLCSIGIDPGISGAVVVIRPQRGIVIWDTPYDEVQKGRKKKKEYNPFAMAKILTTYESYPPVAHVFLEKVHAGVFGGRRKGKGQGEEERKAGATGMFNFGYGYALWVMACVAFRIPLTYVTPQAWKKELMAGMGDKDAARQRACELYPEYADLFARKKDIGRADALLIAEYGRRMLSGGQTPGNQKVIKNMNMRRTR